MVHDTLRGLPLKPSGCPGNRPHCGMWKRQSPVTSLHDEMTIALSNLATPLVLSVSPRTLYLVWDF